MSVINRSGNQPGEGAPAENTTLTMESVLGEVDKRITAANSALSDSLKKTVLPKLFEEQLNPITSMLTGLNEKFQSIPPPGPQQQQQQQQQQPGTGGNPEVNVQLKSLQETVKRQGDVIDQLKHQKQESDQRAERAERHGVIRGALNNLQFISDSAGSTAFTIVEPHIRRMDDGQLVGGIGGDNYPVDAFVKDYISKEHGYLLRASGASGSGAPSSGTGQRMGTRATTEDIKTGMKPEVRKAVTDTIAAALATV